MNLPDSWVILLEDPKFSYRSFTSIKLLGWHSPLHGSVNHAAFKEALATVLLNILELGYEEGEASLIMGNWMALAPEDAKYLLWDLFFEEYNANSTDKIVVPLFEQEDYEQAIDLLEKKKSRKKKSRKVKP